MAPITPAVALLTPPDEEVLEEEALEEAQIALVFPQT